MKAEYRCVGCGSLYGTKPTTTCPKCGSIIFEDVNNSYNPPSVGTAKEKQDAIPCDWKPRTQYRGKFTPYINLIKTFKLNQAMRVHHPDVKCNATCAGCYIFYSVLPKMRGAGYCIQAYHEDKYYIVIRVIKTPRSG